MTANNHYDGFGPRIVNIFRNLLGLPEDMWHEVESVEQHEEEPKHDSKQRTISDFLNWHKMIETHESPNVEGLHELR